MCLNTGNPIEGGILFGPNHSGKTYLSVYAHRGHRPLKNKWSDNITPVREYSIFCTSDDFEWNDPNGHYWGLHNEGTTILGCFGEPLCKFPATTNEADPWHGYPVSPMKDGDNNSPSDRLVELWLQDAHISRTFARRIQRRKI